MTKTIESLRRFPSKEEILFQDHIVDTYFYKKTRKKKSKAAKKNMRAFLILAVAAAVIAALSISAFSYFSYQYDNFLKVKIANSRVVILFKDGALNKEAVRKLEFRGYAKAKSRISGDSMTLTNLKKYNWGDMAIDFRFPIDISKRDISLSLKGRTGGENIHLVLRDAENRSLRINDIYLTSGWKTDTIPLKNIAGDVNLSQINHLRLESGYIGEAADKMDSLIDVTVYIKDIQLTKRRD